MLLVESGGETVVVKDYSPRHPLIRRTLGRWLIRRELRAYRALEGHPAVPRLLGEVDELALAVAHRGGPRFSRRRPWTFSPAFGEALEAAIRELHARGVVHLDLRHRSNIRADMAGRPVLIDFGAALTFRPGGVGARWLLPPIALVDRYAVWKWRRKMRAQASSAASPGGSRPTALHH